jgi:hypothetical protein
MLLSSRGSVHQPGIHVKEEALPYEETSHPGASVNPLILIHQSVNPVSAVPAWGRPQPVAVTSGRT